MKQVDWTDDDGLPRRSKLPDDGINYDPREGIPLDVYDKIMSLYLDATDKFRHDLVKTLHQRGLVVAADFTDKRAIKRYQAALMTVLKHDAFNAITVITENGE